MRASGQNPFGGLGLINLGRRTIFHRLSLWSRNFSPVIVSLPRCGLSPQPFVLTAWPSWRAPFLCQLGESVVMFEPGGIAAGVFPFILLALPLFFASSQLLGPLTAPNNYSWFFLPHDIGPSCCCAYNTLAACWRCVSRSFCSKAGPRSPRGASRCLGPLYGTMSPSPRIYSQSSSPLLRPSFENSRGA